MSKEKDDPKAGDGDTGANGQAKENDSAAEEKVEVSKSELEKLQKKSRDFDGMIEADRKKKRLGRTLPGAEPEKKDSPKADDADDDDDDLQDEFVTKKELQKQIEREALKEASKNPIVDEHYEEVLEFLTFRSGERDTVEGIVAALERAAKVWKSENPDKVSEAKEDDEDKTAKSEIAKDAGAGKGKDKKPETKKKSVLPKNETMDDWYGDSKK